VGDAARSVALRSVGGGGGDGDVVVVDASDGRKVSKRGNDAGDIVVGTTTLPWSDTICMSCGTSLVPPPADNPDAIVDGSDNGILPIIASSPPPGGNIYLRPLKRGRTRRRRASRSKSKEMHDRELSLRRRGGGGGPTTNDASLRDALSKERMRRIAYSYRLGDGRARNCLVMKCTHCGTKKKRKGMEVKKSANNGKRKDDDDVARRKKKGDGRSTRRPSEIGMAVGKKADVESRVRDESSDFISLEGGKLLNSKRQQRPDERQGMGKRKHDENSLVSPLLAGKKKKKKKPEIAKRGDLMDFLSSLND
jgi:hypothetical protein